MIDRLYKVYCYWRLHGNRALFNLVMRKLRGGANAPATVPGHVPPPPPELRAAGAVADIVASRFAAIAPLRVYPVPADKPPRLTIVTDSINAGSLYGGVGTAMILAALLAEARGARLRLVTRTERAHAENLGHVLDLYGIRLAHEVEFAFAPFYDHRYELDMFEDELFLTTSWWTTAATMASVAHERIIYLLQEDERMFYPYGDDRLRCEQVLGSRDIRFVVNTPLLLDHLVADGLDNIAARGLSFQPAFPREIFYPRRTDPSRGKRKLLFYARPNNLRNLFHFGIDLIDAAIVKGAIDLAQWDIVLVGKDIPAVAFAGGYEAERRENLSWAQYAELAGSVDLGLCLMYTPHPSYPPLDLAAAGAVVVTNRFRNKRDLGGYSKNIICAELEREAMVEALAAGARLAVAPERAENHRASALCADWRAALAPVVTELARAA